MSIESINRLSLNCNVKTIFLAFGYRVAVYPSICHILWANQQSEYHLEKLNLVSFRSSCMSTGVVTIAWVLT